MIDTVWASEGIDYPGGYATWVAVMVVGVILAAIWGVWMSQRKS